MSKYSSNRSVLSSLAKTQDTRHQEHDLDKIHNGPSFPKSAAQSISPINDNKILMVKSNVELATTFSNEDEEKESPLMIKMRGIPCLGVIMAFISGIFFATAGFTVTMIDVDATLIVVFRSLVQIVCYFPFALCTRSNLLGVKGERSAILQRSIFGFTCFTLSYYALRFLSLSDASAIAFSAPVYVSIFACILLHEKCGWFQIVTITMAIVGVILISRPTFLFDHQETSTYTPEQRLIGVILSFVTAITMAYTFIAMRRLQKTDVTVVINYFSFFCVFWGIIVILILYFAVGMEIKLPKTGTDFAWMIGNGICGVGGQLFLVMSLKLEEAGLVSLARTFDIVVAFIYQISFLNEPVFLSSIIGAIIVCSGVIMCALRKTYDSKPSIFFPLFRCLNCFGCNLPTSNEDFTEPDSQITMRNGTIIGHENDAYDSKSDGVRGHKSLARQVSLNNNHSANDKAHAVASGSLGSYHMAIDVSSSMPVHGDLSKSMKSKLGRSTSVVSEIVPTPY